MIIAAIERNVKKISFIRLEKEYFWLFKILFQKKNQILSVQREIINVKIRSNDWAYDLNWLSLK